MYNIYIYIEREREGLANLTMVRTLLDWVFDDGACFVADLAASGAEPAVAS